MRKPLLLIATHDSSVRKSVELALHQGYRLLAAESDRQARFLFERFRPFLSGVIVDGSLPIPEGVALPSWLLGQPEPPTVVLIAASQTTAHEVWQAVPGIRWVDLPLSGAKLRRSLE